MEFKLSGFHLRPNLVIEEKVGIVIIILIGLIDSFLISYFTSTDISEYPKIATGLGEWVKNNLSCASGWVNVSILYQERMYLIYTIAMVSILTVCIVVVLSTPKTQLSPWAQDVSAYRALLLAMVHVAGLAFLMCFVGDVHGAGGLREDSKFWFLFNSYFGLVIVVSVMSNVLAYYSMLSVLLYGAILRK